MDKIPQPKSEVRPWGVRLELARNMPSTVVVLTVRPQEALSLQYHHHREELWYVQSGSGFVTIGKERIPAKAGDHFDIPTGTEHRIEGGDTTEITIIEVSIGTYDDNDIVRTEDKYGRPSPQTI